MRGRAKFGTFLKDSIAVLIAGAAERPVEAARDRAPQGRLKKFDLLGRNAFGVAERIGYAAVSIEAKG